MPRRPRTPRPSKARNQSSLPFRYGCGLSDVYVPSTSASPSLPRTIHSMHSSTSSVFVDEDSVSPVAGTAPTVGNKRKWTSEIWDQYDCYNGELFEDSEHRAICKHCKAWLIIVHPDNGTTNFICHYKTCEALCGTNGVSNDGILLQRFDQKVYKEMISLAVIRHGYPLTFAEHEGNRSIHSFLHQGFKPISRNTAKKPCHENSQKREGEV